jgi:alkylation response protein AidB-like acyl-CoA dehydrogenase
MFLIPLSEATIEDTWYVAGMRGTASNTVVVDDAFVPEHRTMSVPALMAGEAGTPFKDEALYRSQIFVPLAALVLAAPQVGLARAAFNIVKAKSTTRGVAYTRHARQADSAAFQLELAHAAMLIQTADMHVERAARDLDAAQAAGGDMAMIDRARIRAHTGYAIERAREAIDRLMTAHGAGAFAEVSPLQRIWRDSNTAGRHAVVNPIHNYEIYGKALVGLSVEENITDLI